MTRIGYLCMDPNASLARNHYAPTIHMAETIRSLEALGHTVTPLLYGDHIGNSESSLRERTRRRRRDAGIVRWGRRLASDALLAGQDLAQHRQLVESFFVEHDIAASYERLYQPRSIVTRTAARRGIPVVVESNSPAEERKAYWGSPLHRLFLKKELATLRRAAAVVVISSPLEDHYVRHGIDPAKIHVIPNGVDADRFKPDAVNRDVRADLGLDEQVVIGFVGNLHPYHGAQFLIPLAQQIAAQRGEAHVLIVGGGPQLPELEHSIENAGLQQHFTLTGPVPHSEVPDYIAAMDIGVLPDFSWYGSSMKLLEYAAMGTAVVAPDTQNIKDVFTHGTTAYLFRPGSTSALIGAITELQADQDLRRNLGRAARSHVTASHTWNANGARIAEIIEATVR